jgi:hypothetical protein
MDVPRLLQLVHGARDAPADTGGVQEAGLQPAQLRAYLETPHLSPINGHFSCYQTGRCPNLLLQYKRASLWLEHMYHAFDACNAGKERAVRDVSKRD